MIPMHPRVTHGEAHHRGDVTPERTIPSPLAKNEKPDTSRTHEYTSHTPTQAREWERDKAELSVRPQWESICVQYWLVFDPCHSLLSSVSPQAPYWPSLTVCLHTHTHTQSHNLNQSSASCHERDNLDGDGVRHGGGVRGRKKIAKEKKFWKKGRRNKGFGFGHAMGDKWSDSKDPLWAGEGWWLRDGWPGWSFDGMWIDEGKHG